MKQRIAIAFLSTSFGFFMGYVYPKWTSPRGNKIEYFLELRQDKVILETDWGMVYEIPIDSISKKLIDDNQ